jgi:hypothetical protein
VRGVNRAAVVFLGVFVLLFVGGMIDAAVGPDRPALSPTPHETPWLWVDPDPAGGACYVLADTLGPCFSKPSPEAK